MDNDGWVNWNGKCKEPYLGPLDPETIIDAKWSDGYCTRSERAGVLRWWYDTKSSDSGYHLPNLISYRILP